MKLQESQLKLIRHLARFNLMSYEDCLRYLDTDGNKSRTDLSYVFRPLTKNKYLVKHKDKDNSVTITAKGRALFPEEKALTSTGGGAANQARTMVVSRMAALMERHDIPCVGALQDSETPYFIPSARWRDIAPGILSTTRFTGMLLAGSHRLAVYDIGDGVMEWQIKAEGSLFYTRYGSYATKATGMLLVCRGDLREQIARNIIRQTMHHRRQLLRENCLERNRPTAWSRSPIKLKAQYEHAYLTTPERLSDSIQRILDEKDYIQALCDDLDGTLSGGQGIGDIEAHPRRIFVNPATDLLKYVRFFSAVKDHLMPVERETFYRPQITVDICIYPEDDPIAKMYLELNKLEGMTVYAYRSEEDPESD